MLSCCLLHLRTRVLQGLSQSGHRRYPPLKQTMTNNAYLEVLYPVSRRHLEEDISAQSATPMGSIWPTRRRVHNPSDTVLIAPERQLRTPERTCAVLCGTVPCSILSGATLYLDVHVRSAAFLYFNDTDDSDDRLFLDLLTSCPISLSP